MKVKDSIPPLSNKNFVMMEKFYNTEVVTYGYRAVT